MGFRYLEELGHLTIAQIHSLKVRPYPFSKTSPWCLFQRKFQPNWTAHTIKRAVCSDGAHLRFVKNFAGLPFFFMEERAACCGR